MTIQPDQTIDITAEVCPMTFVRTKLRLERMKPGDPRFAATFTVLGEYVNHHVKEEEEEMFPKVRRARVNLKALGARLMGRKIRLAAAPK